MKREDIERLAKYYAELNSWEWPEDLVSFKPYKFYELDYYSNSPEKVTKHTFVAPIMNVIKSSIGDKECLRGWWKYKNIGDDENFEKYWQEKHCENNKCESGENMNTRFVMNVKLTDNETNISTSTQMEFDSWLNNQELPTIIEQFSMFLLACGYQPGSIAKYIDAGA